MKTNWLYIVRPEATEYAPYYERYISLVSGNDVLTTLEEASPQTVALFSSLSEKEGDFRYSPEKWSVKQVLGHIIDTERIFAYRALRISRNDATPIEGYDQDDYVRYGPFSHCQLSNLVEEYTHVRNATLSLFRSLDQEAWTRRGIANKNEVTVQALAYIVAGHELHHRNVLNDKYSAILTRR